MQAKIILKAIITLQTPRRAFIASAASSSTTLLQSIKSEAMPDLVEENSGQTEKFWDKSAKGYAKKPIEDQEAYEKKLKMTQQYLRKDMEVLEYGCGTGETSLIHAPFVKHIVGTDISGGMIEIANQKKEEAQIKNADFQQASIDQLDLVKESKDAILGLSILHLLKNRDEAIAKTYQWLKPGGLFVTSTACIGDMGSASFLKRLLPIGAFFGVTPYVNTMTKADLKESLAKNKFDVEYEWQPKPDAAVFIIARKST